MDGVVDISEIKQAIEGEDKADLEDMFKKGGITAVASRLKEKQNAWETTPLNIAVTGQCGSGKSSFVNTMRGLKASDKGASKVGVTETTDTPAGYPYHHHPNVVLWDLPGMGTPKYPAKSYLDDIGFEKFDFFIIITKSRFTENDMTLAKEVMQRKKKFYLVRSHIQSDVNNATEDYPSMTQETIIQTMKQDLENNLEVAGFKDMPIFLIDNHHQSKYEFATLTIRLIEDLPELKCEAFVFALDVVSADMLKQKEKMLRRRIWGFAFLSSAVGAVPLPGLSVVADIGILVTELSFYRRQLGLDDDSINRLASVTGKDVSLLKSQITIEFARKVVTKEMVLNLLKIGWVGIGLVAEEVLRFIPWVGIVAGASLSFGTTFYVLSSQLKKMKKQADRLLAKALEKN